MILGAVVVLFVSNLVPVELVAVGAALALWATGVLDVDQVLAGFGDPAVVLIASLFVVSEALDATGVTTWAGQQVLAWAGDSRTRIVVLVLGLVAGLTALISVNGAVAALVPMVVVVALRTHQAPSRLLLPLAFAAHAGSLLALTGTPVNVLVSEAADAAGAGTFGFFEFALVGVPLLVGTVAVVVVFGSRLLPERSPRSLAPDLSAHARTLGHQYLRDHRVFRLALLPSSPCVGLPDADIDPGEAGVAVIGVQVGGEGPLAHPPSVGPDDVLLVRGEPGAVAGLAASLGLGFDAAPFTLDDETDLVSRELGVAELVVPPRSQLVGQVVFPGMVTDSGDLVLLAVQRNGRDVGPVEAELAPGDTLLVQGRWAELEHHVGVDRDVLAVDDPARIRSQGVPLGPRSTPCLLVVAAMVVLLATGAVPPAIAGLAAAGAMVLLRVVTTDQAYRGVSWTTIVLVGAMIPLSTAMTETGAAATIADHLVGALGDSSPYLLLLGLFVLTATLGQLISNMATALIVIPIAISAATEMGVSPRPVMMAVTVAAAASLLTPVATPANLMVMGPGGYRFGDYWKLGLPLLVLYGAVAVGLVPLIWSF